MANPELDKVAKERADTGFVMFMDIFEGRGYFAEMIAQGVADTEIRMAIFYALNGRYVNPLNTTDALAAFGFDITMPLELIKAKAAIKAKGLSEKDHTHLDFDSLKPIGIAMKKMVDIPATMEFRNHRASGARQALAKDNAVRASRQQFNSQHLPAPEGTVKELAAKYGKSLSEIRKLKAEGLLHTLTNAEAQA
jgi:hypothetical protein